MGLVPAIVGMAVVIAAQYQMGNSWRIGVEPRETTPLITVGLFGIVRNPIFSGMLLATAGMLTMVPNLISAVAFGSLFVGLQMQVRLIEEPHLVRVHGNQYLSYAGLVGRFLPWIGRLA
jgi:protein-S-isoprenylcysteine O-methyltransferase Ste14